jgi:predicted enzyme related to lactoylglutathione lyase
MSLNVANGGAVRHLIQQLRPDPTASLTIVRMSPLRAIKLLAVASVLACGAAEAAAQLSPPATPDVAVAPQYGTTHVYVPFADFDRFVASFVSTFGGTTSKAAIVTVTPAPSLAKSQVVMTSVGNLSVFGFTTPIPYPFGDERTGSLVSDIDAAVQAARANGADVIVAPFADALGRDAVIQWPGGVNMQLYWHTTPPSYPPLAAVPENRVYVSKDRADDFIRDFVAFSHGAIMSDEPTAPGVEIGRAGETYRRVRIESRFGKVSALVTDGHLRWPYGREVAGYEVSSMAETLANAAAAGVEVLVAPTTVDRRVTAIVLFPGGYIAEIHAAVRP